MPGSGQRERRPHITPTPRSPRVIGDQYNVEHWLAAHAVLLLT